MTDAASARNFDVVLELDKPRRLVIDFNTLCRAEEVSDLSFLDMTAELTGVRLRALVWAGLKYEEGEKELTLEQVGILCGEHYITVMSAFAEAWFKAMPDPEADEYEWENDENPPETATAPS
jgi:hypothetical protein